MNIHIRKTTSSNIGAVDFSNLTFGENFSDHQFQINYRNGQWESPEIIPYDLTPMYPAMTTLHYGQAVFEGMKAFTYSSGKINIFRLDSHFERFNRSCKRVCIPEIPKNVFEQGLIHLVNLERAWVPQEKYKSLYLRPFVYATDETLGLRASTSYRFHILCSPVGNFYSEGIKPIRLTTMPEYVRAVSGGVGDVKVPGNYAASLQPTTKAQQMGYTQVLWLDAIEKKYVEEVGSMNIFFLIDDTLITPPINGSILPGITRMSVLELARKHKMNVEERPVAIDELIKAHENGKLKEIFGSGTAAVISPVGHIHHQGKEITLPQKEMGPVARWFYDRITGIQHGDHPDDENWCTIL
ncbi:branched-chain amino acid aminotransferase [Balneolaceae bacterium ANBcel3]|nr:branched-chain amino acid aminotransferase [Balneolaceae bacterium ANBcel3]